MTIMPLENQGDETIFPAISRHGPVFSLFRNAKEVPRLSRKRFACLTRSDFWVGFWLGFHNPWFLRIFVEGVVSFRHYIGCFFMGRLSIQNLTLANWMRSFEEKVRDFLWIGSFE